jgi:hypothetical protein
MPTPVSREPQVNRALDALDPTGSGFVAWEDLFRAYAAAAAQPPNTARPAESGRSGVVGGVQEEEEEVEEVIEAEPGPDSMAGRGDGCENDATGGKGLGAGWAGAAGAGSESLVSLSLGSVGDSSDGISAASLREAVGPGPWTDRLRAGASSGAYASTAMGSQDGGWPGGIGVLGDPARAGLLEGIHQVCRAGPWG